MADSAPKILERPYPLYPPYRYAWVRFLLVALRRGLYCLAVFIVVWFLWQGLTVSNPEIDLSRQEVSDRAILKAVGELRANAGELRHIVLLHFENDPSDYVSEKLREELDRQGGFTLRKKSFWDRFCRLVGRINDGIASREDAVNAAKGEDADGVIWGSVKRLENERDGATFTGNYELYDIRRGRVAYSGRIAESSVPEKVRSLNSGGSVKESPEQYMPREGGLVDMAMRTPWHIRFLWFIVVMLLLPVVTISFMRTMVAKKSNGVNAFVLGIYTTVDLILAFFMVGGSLSSFFTVVVFLLAGILAFLYNIKIMTFAVRLEG